MKRTLIILALILGFSTQAQTRCEELKEDLTYLMKAVKDFEDKGEIDRDLCLKILGEVLDKIEEPKRAYDVGDITLYTYSKAIDMLEDMYNNNEISIANTTLIVSMIKNVEYQYRECQ